MQRSGQASNWLERMKAIKRIREKVIKVNIQGEGGIGEACISFFDIFLPISDDFSKFHSNLVTFFMKSPEMAVVIISMISNSLGKLQPFSCKTQMVWTV